MFTPYRPRGGPARGLSLAGLIYHGAVRHVRRSHGNALWGLLVNIGQTVVFVLSFVLFFEVTGLRGTAIRGDFLLYVLSGVFLFLTHNKAVAAVSTAEGPASPMMKHAPMNPIIAIGAAALGALYIQVLSIFVILLLYQAAIRPIEIEVPGAAMAMLLLAWGSGVALGLMLYALRPWAPDVAKLIGTIYQRLNFIASGKMFVANMLPGFVLPFFLWNPLFHAIDQARGFIFINYVPYHTSALFPLWVSLGALTLGLMGVFHTARHASASWEARR